MKFVEDLNTELKRAYTPDLIKTVIAFANTKGGKLYIGVEDDGSVIGLDDLDKVMLSVTNAIRDSIKPDITPFSSCEIVVVEDKRIIQIEVQKGSSSPYYLARKGIRPEGVFIRQGSSSVPSSEANILKMIKEVSGENYEKTRSLNQNLTFVTVENEFKNISLEFGKAQMKTLGIMNEDGLYTNLGLLLSDQCQHTIKMAVFEGCGKSVFKDRYEFTGSLLKQMREVHEYVNRYNRTRSTFQGIDRIDKRDYPVEAIRESLLNAIVHKDYAFASSTLINVFDDRMEFITIGGLLKGISLNDILIGVSVLRNKGLANVFYRLNWIEAYGTGLFKIRESYEPFKVQAQIEVSDNAFKISLPNTNNQKLETQVKEEIVYYNTREQEILNMFQKATFIKRKEVEITLDISQPMAVNLLKKLLLKGAIIKLGQGKNTVYQLKK